MQKNRFKLLITLVLLLGATATAWTGAGAAARTDDGGSSGTVSSPSIPKPGVGSFSGDPDQPHASSAAQPPHGAQVAPSFEGGVIAKDVKWNWYRWISRIWVAWQTGMTF